MPKISVCIPSHNGGYYIKEQLQSILSQLSENDEIIISDDFSTDNTYAIVSSLKDTRIKFYHHQKSENPYQGLYEKLWCISQNIQHALYLAKGEYIFLSDQDDIWLSGKVAAVTHKLASNDIVVHNCKVVDNQMNIIIHSYFDQVVNPSVNIWRTINRSSFHGCCIAFSKNFLVQHIFPFPSLPIGHDTWIGITAIKNKAKIYFEKEPLILYRRHENNVSASTGKSPNSLFFKLQYRLYLVRAYLLSPSK